MTLDPQSTGSSATTSEGACVVPGVVHDVGKGTSVRTRKRTLIAVAVERITSVEAFRGLESEWRALEANVGLTNPFLTFDWAAAWWAHLRESKLGVQDKLFARALRSPDGELVGIAPLLLTVRPGHGPVITRTLQFFGPDPNITEIREMLVHSDDRAMAHAALFDDLRDCSDSWDWMVVSGLSSSGELKRAIDSRFSRVERVRDLPEYSLALAPTWDEFKSTLSRNIKESLRHCYNAPKRDRISPRFDVVTDPRSVAPALEDFFRLHGARAALGGTVRHNDVFAQGAARRFLVDVCQRFAERGSLRLFRLQVGGAAVAMRIAFALGDSLYLYYSGYDPVFSKYSVMTTLVAEAIRHAIEDGFRTISLSTGNDVSKTRWGPREIMHREFLVISPSLRGWIARQLDRQARALLQSSRLSSTRAAALLTRRTA